MGNAASTIGPRVRSCLDAIGAVYINLILGALYTTFLGVELAAAILVVGAGADETWQTAFAFGFAMASAVVHFGIMLGALGVVDGYVLYPVEPRMLYAFTDVVIGLTFGLVTGAYLMDATAKTMPTVGSVLLTMAYGVVLYKIVIIVRGVMNNTRDRKTGQLLDEPVYSTDESGVDKYGESAPNEYN